VKAAPLASLTLLWPHLRPHWRRAALAGVALIASSSFLLGIGQGLRVLIDRGFGAGALDAAAALMFALVLGFGAATACRYYLVSWLGERVAADLRRATFDHVLSLPPAWFETARTGDILSRLTADVALLQSLVGSAVSMALRNALMGAGALVLLIATSAKLALITLLVVPLVVGPLIWFGRRERRLSRATQERVADLSATAEESLNGIATVQAFTQENALRARFGAEAERSAQAAMRRIASRAFLILAVILLGFGAITFSLWVGGRDVLAGRMSGGDLTAFVFYAVLLAQAMATMTEVWGEVQRAGAAADRLGEILAEKPAIAAPAAPVALPAPQGRIALESVAFAYPSRAGQSTLEGLTLALEPGERVALVGPSGAGKTTVLKLLLRFMDPDHGRVLLDGVDVRLADPAAVRARIALVAQEPLIFSGSVAENIRFGRPNATDTQVAAAAEAAAAAGFIAALPQAYDTPLGPRGAKLSGGQRQRIAIARAVLRDAPILLLDEATSALDAESEQAVQQALARLSAGRTTLVIAHRLATVRSADRIVVMEGGRIVAMGTHEALVRQGGLYARLAALQFTEAVL
jgi:ATP-binding cassette, subfamily B, bacterial